MQDAINNAGSQIWILIRIRGARFSVGNLVLEVGVEEGTPIEKKQVADSLSSQNRQQRQSRN
jgi:hypothetical protein